LSGPLEVRNWQPGDLYQPAGSAADKKLKALFQDARIPVWERAAWPVLTDAGVIVWSRRFGADARVAARGGAGPVLRIREIGESGRPQ
jgi:tRNA(Ile)-lysidine synthase